MKSLAFLVKGPDCHPKYTQAQIIRLPDNLTDYSSNNSIRDCVTLSGTLIRPRGSKSSTGRA